MGEVTLRPYQTAAIRGVYESLREHRSTLLVLPTGCGKTIVFSSIVAAGVRAGRRMLILVHRDELIQQAIAKVRLVADTECLVEQASRKDCAKLLAFEGPLVVVASVQSLVRRLDRFPADAFDLLITDEAHHARARSYGTIYDHFGAAKHLGVTATPERGDGRALGKVFADVGFDMGIEDAISGGWLVPIRSKVVALEHLDLSKVKVRAGDFAEGELASVMSQIEVLREIASPAVDLCMDRPTLVFAVTVAHAHLLAEAIRQEADDRGLTLRVEAVDGRDQSSAGKAGRREVTDAFKAGDIDVLVNVMVLTEGFDAPICSAVVMARPTKSRSLYIQCLGRGTRPLPGVVDGPASAQARREAIVASEKPDLLVVDFTDNSDRHDLVQAVDLLGGSDEDPDVAVARELIRSGEEDDIFRALRKIRAERSRRTQAARAKWGDPFALFGLPPVTERVPTSMTPRQLEVLSKHGLPGLDAYCKRGASKVIEEMSRRQRAKLCTYKQAKLLAKNGVPVEQIASMTFVRASALIERLVAARWRPAPRWWAA